MSGQSKGWHSMTIKRGQIYYADLSPVIGSEQGGVRPVLILQNDMGNRHSPTTIVAILTSRHTKNRLPTHHWLSSTYGLARESMVELEQIRTIDKSRLRAYVGEVSAQEMQAIGACAKVSLGL